MIEQFTNKDGLKVYVDPVAGVKNIDIRAVVQTGSVHETEDVAGISHALEHCLFLRTPNFPNKQSTFDYASDHAFYKNANTYYTRTVYETLGLERDAMFHLLGEVVLHPMFGDEATKNEMHSVRREAKSNLDNIEGLRSVFNDYVMFGAPFGRRVLGFSDRLDFTEEQLAEYYKSRYSLDKTSLLVVGDTSPEEVEKLIEDHFDFSSYQKTYPDFVLPTAASPFDGTRSFGHLRGDSENARIALSVARTPLLTEKMRNQPWAYSAAISLISRTVFNTLRIDMGLSYDGSFGAPGYNHESARRLQAFVTVDPDKTDKAIAALRGVLARDPRSYTDEELARHLNSERLYAAEEVDEIFSRGDLYINNYIAHGLEPISPETSYEQLQTTTIEDVRTALNHIYEVWQSSPEYETVTGPKEAMGKRAVIAQGFFA